MVRWHLFIFAILSVLALALFLDLALSPSAAFSQAQLPIAMTSTSSEVNSFDTILKNVTGDSAAKEVLEKLNSSTEGGVGKTLYACNTTTISNPKTGRYTTIQAAVDAGENGKETVIIIYICPGNYKEDIEINTSKVINFVGEKSLWGLSRVVLQGAGKVPNIVNITNDCPYLDGFCYGRIIFQNVDFKKIGTGTYPTRAIFLDNPSECSSAGACQHDRAVIDIFNGSLEAFEQAIAVRGEVNLNIDAVTFKNANSSSQTSALIATAAGGEGIMKDGSGAVTSCNHNLSPRVIMKNSKIYDNKTLYYSLYLQGATATIDSVKVYDNAANGIAFFFTECAVLKVSNSEFYNNSMGGIFDPNSYDSITISSTKIHDNTGSIFFGGSNVTISDSSVIDNVVPTRSNGALNFFSTDKTFKSTNTCWTGNTPHDVYHQTAGDSTYSCTSSFSCGSSGCY